MSKIVQTIDEIIDYIESCRFVPLSTTKISVNKDEITELLSELKLKTPDEIKKYQKMISNRDAILTDAKRKAEEMIADAAIQTSELISEHEIMQQAYIQANDIIKKATEQAQSILDRATEDANDIRLSAMNYTDDSLLWLEKIITHSIENFNSRYDIMLKSLTQSLEIVQNNRKELYGPEEESSETVSEGTEDNGNFEDYTVPVEII